MHTEIKMAARVTDVNKHLAWALLLITTFFVKEVKAQDEREVYKSVMSILVYPQQLGDSCITTYTNLLISVSNEGKVTKLELSDSSPMLLKKAFEENKSKFKFSIFEALLRKKNLTNCAVIIPIVYSLSKERCPSAFNDFEELLPNYYYYNKKRYEGLTFNLDPLIINVYDTMH